MVREKSKQELLKEYKSNLGYCYYIENQEQIELWEKRIKKLKQEIKKDE